MGDAGSEIAVALAVAAVSERAIGRPLGMPCRHDDGSEPMMVDFLFKKTSPPVALEVTAVIDADFVETADAALKINDELDAHARRLGAGRWTVHFASGTWLRPLVGSIERIMSRGLDEVDSPLREGLPDGVISVYIEPRGMNEVQIGTVKGGRLRGFSTELSVAIEANMGKLAKMLDYERHLAIDLQAMRAGDPGETPPPVLPDSLDVLWVVRRSVSAARKTPVIWVTRRRERIWKVNGAPYE